VRRIFISLIVAVVLVGVAPYAQGASRLALIVGNSDYQYVSKLENTLNDAKEVSSQLRKLGFQVVEAINFNAAQLRKAVDHFSDRLRPGDIALFYYAGHGVAINGVNFVVPVDTQLVDQSSIDKYLYPIIEIIDVLSDDQKHQALVFLDACRDSPFAGSLKNARNIRVSRGLAKFSSVRPSADKGLARIESGYANLFVAFATQPGNVAADGLAGEKHSPFTGALLKHLSDKVEVRELMTKVRASVANRTNFQQIPWEQNSLLKNIYLAGKPPPPKAIREPEMIFDQPPP
jgi:uncharacterized caspase-like protein